MKQIGHNKRIVDTARRRDEKNQITRDRRIEREMTWDTETKEEKRTKTTKREKRGPDGRLQETKSRTRNTPNRIDEFEDDINYISKHRDELP